MAQRGDPERPAWVAERIPTGEIGEPEDIDWAVTCAVPQAAKHVNGHRLTADVGACSRFPVP